MSYFGIPIRNGLPIGLGSVAPLASGGGSPFSPLSLFAGGAPGAWYDPSDMSTLFQDSAGTTPVTAVEQPVGLMLDKSQGLVLGSELVVNGDFSGGTTTGWTSVSGGVLTVDAGRLKVTNGVANVGGAEQFITTVAGTMYEFSVTQSNGNSGAGRVYIGTSSGAVNLYVNYSASGVITVKFFATTTTTYINLRTNSFTASDFVYFDNVTIKALPGNHAFQSTAASRPVLSARVNLLTKTEQFDDAAWVKAASTISANSTTAPDGTATADTFTPNTANAFHTASQANITLQNTNYVLTFRIKANGYNFAAVQLANNNTFTKYFEGVFNLQTGAVENTGRSVTYTGTRNIVSLGNGWYECSITVNSVDANSTGYAQVVVLSTNDPASSFAGNGTSGVYIWGADLRPADQATGLIPTYQRVNTATDYNTVGYNPYLRFDGIDDSLSTNSINFTSTDKMSVFAGVRKLSDAAAGVLYELSASFAASNGTFYSFAGNQSGTGAAAYAFGSKGTLSASLTGPTTYAAPITNVITGLGDISGDLATLRINGTQAAQSTADQGTGNYGNHPLYIGRRGGTTLPFNGQLYSMILVGKAVTAEELSSTETYINSKTGAF